MKKLSILAASFAAIVFAACGNKTAQNTESADSVVKSFEQEQIARCTSTASHQRSVS